MKLPAPTRKIEVILNTNSLPFPISAGLRTIILQHIADSFMACVLSFRNRNRSPDASDGCQSVEIAVDTDGSLIYISAFPSPHHTTTPETHFSFSHEADYHDTAVSLNKERERFQAWEHTFVACCRLGSYEVELMPLLELEEIVASD